MKLNNRTSPSFRWHNATQFLGALNDNMFRWLTVFFLIGMLGEENAPKVMSFTGIVFVIPFLLFTAPAGVLADRFSKRDIIVLAKIAELAVMTLGLAAFYVHSIPGVYVVLFLMCTQSAFFGPCKYGIIPELVETEKISRANSFLEGLTYLSIVIGTAITPLLVDAVRPMFAVAALACVAIAAAGVWTSRRIGPVAPRVTGETMSLFFVKDLWHALRQVRHDRYLILAILAAAYFLLIGGFAQMSLIPYGMEVCGFTDTQSGYLFLIAAVGIGIGSYLAGRISARSVEIGIIPIGAVGMAVTAMVLGLWRYVLSAAPDYWGLVPIFMLVGLFGIFCGLFIVPINAFIQLRCPDAVRGRVIAAAKLIGWLGVLSAAGVVGLFSGIWDVPASTMFIVMGALTLVLAIVTIVMLPDFLVRMLIILLTRVLYRIRMVGVENVPAQGPALIIANHVSWADPFVLLATQQRRIRFIMDRSFYGIRWLNWLFRLGRLIPISANDPPKKIVAALREGRKALDEGCLVCIFAEGAVTRTGMMARFRAGFEKIARGSSHPIIPAYIGGLWGSIFSHYYGKIMSRWPRRLSRPVSVRFGRPMPSDAAAIDIRRAIEELSVDYFNDKKPQRKTLGQLFVHSARRYGLRPLASDTTGKRVSFGKALIGATALADKLEPMTEGQPRIGIFLPPTVGGALANLAAALLNKPSVNLSYVASAEDRRYMIQQAGLRTILTSRAFLEKLQLAPDSLPEAVFLEDVAQSITGADKRRALLKALFCPSKRLARAQNADPDDTAVILFSSGSSGRPKGVELTHHNIQSNLEMVLLGFRVYRTDRLCAILPMFHSFGLTCTLWLPILVGVPVSYVPNPLDGKLVGQTVRDDKATLLFATPTFLLNYLRRCEKEDFATLRFVVAGAEKLKVPLIDAFEKKFGRRPREGYGATELSPLVALNVDDVELGGVSQVGTKEGTVGHAIPGLALRVVHPETGEQLGFDEPGVLWVKGANVMKGYLNNPEKTAQVVQNGWYNTGDIVTVDEDGFIAIRDRLSRFSKIGGEMVPHLTIEEVCLEGLGMHEPVVAVTSVPDEKKGEQLVLLYDQSKVDIDALHRVLAESSLPRLYIPKRENIIPVETIPHLGSGKLDMMTLRQIATERLNINP